MEAEREARRVYRSRSDRMLGGVCGGLGSYLGIDPVLVRLSFVALIFAGVGLILYIIAWIVIPEEPVGNERAPVPRSGSTGAQLIVGSILVALGIIFLVDAWVVPVRRLLLPLAIIAIGLAIMAAGRSRS